MFVLCDAVFTICATAQITVTTSGGTTNSVPVYTSSVTLGSSPIAVSGSNVGIGATSPRAKLETDVVLKLAAVSRAMKGTDRG